MSLRRACALFSSDPWNYQYGTGVTAKSPTKVGTLTPVVEVLTGSLPGPVLGRPDERAGAGDFFGNRGKLVDNEPLSTEVTR